MTYEELETFARLRDREYVKQFSLIAGLGRGEAAALAIAHARGFDLATDDQDAIRVATALAPEWAFCGFARYFLMRSNKGC
jgi:predicted nucleic acid-binding protein